MKYEYPQLPFPRGTVYSQSVYTPSSTDGVELEGNVFEVWDKRYMRPVKLRVVRNATNANLTLTPGLLVGFYKDATDKYRYMGANVYALNADGDPAKPIDDFYPSNNPVVAKPNELFYVVEEGPCSVQKIAASSGQALTAGNKCFADSATSKLDATVSAGTAVGRVLVDAATTATTATVYVFAGFSG